MWVRSPPGAQLHRSTPASAYLVALLVWPVELGGYVLPAGAVVPPVDQLDDLARAYLGDREQIGSITRDQLRKRLREGDVVVLDVRPNAEYDAGHIRGAVSIPVGDLKSRLKEIPDGTEVVAHCRGPFCVYADDAVRLLAKSGRSAVRLEDGFPEWAAEQLPSESSD